VGEPRQKLTGAAQAVLVYGEIRQPAKQAMTTIETPQDQPMAPETRRALKLAGLGFALLALAGGLFWLRFGSQIYFDMIAFAQGCF